MLSTPALASSAKLRGELKLAALCREVSVESFGVVQHSHL
jgi:hypothetical protein